MKNTIISCLLDALNDGGARDIFGICGDAINPFVDAVTKDDRFRWITVRHEENAGYAASAQSELTGKIGVCAATSGPGALHLINGLYNAQKEGGAVVAITGQIARGQRGSDYHKEMDLTKVFDDVCAYQVVIESPDQVPRMIEIAIQKALIERVVVRIEIPIDLIESEVPSMHFKHPLVHVKSSSTPKISELEKAAELLNSGKKVTIYSGIGCRDARQEVLELAAKLNAPLVHSLRAKDIFDEAGECVMGMTGLIGNPAGYHAVFGAEVLLLLGTDFPYSDFFPDGIPIIQVDINLDHIGRRAPVSLGMVGDISDTLRLLNPMIKQQTETKFRDQLSVMRNKWFKQMAEQASLSRTSEPLHPQLIAKAVSDEAADDAIFAIDVGECTVWTARQMKMNGKRRMVGGFNHGAIGAGLPVALGAAALNDGREVWVLCGDGGFGMSMNDFVTAVRYEWPLKVIVFNNSEFGFVKMEMETAGLGYNPTATKLVNPDFALYAKACGGDGVKVQHANEIIPAIQQAKASTKPFIIDAIVSAGELVMPPHINMNEVVGFGKSKMREALMGIKGDHEIWKNWVDEFNVFFR